MFKKNWRIARRTASGELYVNHEHRFWTKRGAAMAAAGLNQTFSGLDGLSKALGGRFFFALHVKGEKLFKHAEENGR